MLLRGMIATLVFMVFFSCEKNTKHDDFPSEMVKFVPSNRNPLFTGTGKDTWDKHIRERGYILHDEGIYKLWYTGYNGSDTSIKYLGYATSKDGFNWTRYPDNPVFNKKWTEDVQVIKNQGQYLMVAEGRNDVAHLLKSADGIHWQEQGNLQIFKSNGEKIAGPYGTPVLWHENDKWYLFYERNDMGVWLAKSISHDLLSWQNVQDDPVLSLGPDEYDQYQIALDQIVKYRGLYYGYYHASGVKDYSLWTSNVAVSRDLIHWQKYEKNPIVSGNYSSPILVYDGNQYRLYTMHPDVRVYFPVKK